MNPNSSQSDTPLSGYPQSSYPQQMYPYQTFPNNDENLNVKRYISLFISNWYWFAVSLFIAITLAYSINRYSAKTYSASATLLIKTDKPGSLSSNAASVIPGGDIFRNQQTLVNEIGILRSYSLNYSVMKELKDFQIVYVAVGRRGIVEKFMYKSCPFMVICDSLGMKSFGKVNIEILNNKQCIIRLNNGLDFEKTVSFGERFKEFGYDFIIEPRTPGSDIFEKNGSNKYYFLFTSPQSLAVQYSSKLSVAPIEKDASIVTLSVTGLVPEQEVDYLNKLMEVYINYGLENKNATADSTLTFI